MSERSKERIKFYTEWIKMLVLVEVALGTGIVSAIHEKQQFGNARIFLGSVIFFELLLIIVTLTSFTRKEIDKL